MTCSIYGCQEPAEYPFPCCGWEHGKTLRAVRAAIQRGERTVGRHTLSDAEVEHYQRFMERNGDSKLTN